MGRVKNPYNVNIQPDRKVMQLDNLILYKCTYFLTTHPTQFIKLHLTVPLQWYVSTFQKHLLQPE